MTNSSLLGPNFICQDCKVNVKFFRINLDMSQIMGKTEHLDIVVQSHDFGPFTLGLYLVVQNS